MQREQMTLFISVGRNFCKFHYGEDVTSQGRPFKRLTPPVFPIISPPSHVRQGRKMTMTKKIQDSTIRRSQNVKSPSPTPHWQINIKPLTSQKHHASQQEVAKNGSPTVLGATQHVTCQRKLLKNYKL